ncbi:MAG: XdhC family protein [bacterium]|nr:XdhC family protein [bacterium]
MKRETLDALLDARAERRPVARLTWLDGDREALASPGAPGLEAALEDAVVQALHSDAAVVAETDEGRVFVHPFNPPLRLAIVGAVHIAQHLAELAGRLGYDVTVVDPRRGFLTEARFPGVTLDARWPDAALEAFGLDARSAVVTLSHDSKIDEPALSVALRSSAFYVGALGSRRTQAKRRERLLEAGLGAVDLERIHGPVGLDLGAKSPAEIALSVAAELTATLRDRSAAS